MKFGLDVGAAGRFSDARLLAGLAADAEAAGWDGFFIWDILLGASQAAPEPVADPWVALTAIALATSRIRFGAFMTPLEPDSDIRAVICDGVVSVTPLTWSMTARMDWQPATDG